MYDACGFRALIIALTIIFFILAVLFRSLLAFSGNAVLTDQDIAFFESGTDAGGSAGFVFDASLATSFKPGGVSVFGATDIPVSVYVQPNGKLNFGSGSFLQLFDTSI